jgi:hypothetical protein
MSPESNEKIRYFLDPNLSRRHFVMSSTMTCRSSNHNIWSHLLLWWLNTENDVRYLKILRIQLQNNDDGLDHYNVLIIARLNDVLWEICCRCYHRDLPCRKRLRWPNKVSEIGDKFTGENESWWTYSEYRAQNGAERDKLPSSTHILEATGWQTSAVGYTTPPVRFTSQLSKKNMDSSTGASIPSCIAPVMRGKWASWHRHTYTNHERCTSLYHTLLVCLHWKRLVWGPAAQVR